MKLRKAELWAILITAVFLAAAVSWQLGTRHRVPAFSVTTAEDAGTVRAVAVPAGADGTASEQVSTRASAETKSEAGAVVNINTADVEELKMLSGIGDALAARIVAYREENGPFARVEEITRVSGIGMKILEANLDRLTVGTEEDAA